MLLWIVKMSYNNILVAIDGGSYASKNSTSVQPDVLTISKANSIYLNEHGDKMKGVLDMNNNKIINVAEPTEIRDISTKFYVDNAIKDQQQSINEQFLDKKGLIRSDKLPPIDKSIKQHFYILNIGESSTSPYKTSKFQIPLSYETDLYFKQTSPYKTSKFQIPLSYDRTTDLYFKPTYPILSRQMINFQITPLLDSDIYHDEIFMNIQRYEIRYNPEVLDVYILTVRSNNIGWGLSIKAYLTLTINFNFIPEINSS
jgi:hypothetical protein